MERTEQIAALLQAQCRQYPQLQLQDLLKALHQSVMGCGHFVSDEGAGLEWLRREAETHQDPLGVELLGPTYFRVHLGVLEEKGLAPESLLHLFVLSAEDAEGTSTELEEGIAVLLELAEKGDLPFSVEETTAAVDAWRRAGFPACHHSPRFRETYHPAYRVIRKEFLRRMELMAKIDQLCRIQQRITVAIEGGSASGKTTLSQWLGRVYDCHVFHMDDYFLRPEQRTPERLAEAGGNVDRERFLEEVLLPLSRGEAVRSRRFDCRTQTLGPEKAYAPKALNIVEGVYSLHPALASYYDLRVFLNVNPECQRRRILKRNLPEMAQRFFDVWIPMENAYFGILRPEESCHIRLALTDGLSISP